MSKVIISVNHFGERYVGEASFETIDEAHDPYIWHVGTFADFETAETVFVELVEAIRLMCVEAGVIQASWELTVRRRIWLVLLSMLAGYGVAALLLDIRGILA